jgi:hypothetical protein
MWPFCSGSFTPATLAGDFESDTLGNEVPALCGVSGNLLSLADEVIETR